MRKPFRAVAEKVFRTLNGIHDGLLVIVLIAAVLISGYCLYDNLYILSRSNDRELTKYKPGTSSYTPEESPISDEMVAWLTIDNTDIDYPVMQGSNNLTYLNKDPYGKFSLSGSIFLDSRNSPGFTDEYSLIYGHHLEYGRMFGALDAFLDGDYAASHRSGTLLIGRSGEKRCRLEVFAVLRASAEERTVFDIDTGADFRSYISSHAAVKLGTPGSRVLALSTCDSQNDSMRIIVACNII